MLYLVDVMYITMHMYVYMDVFMGIRMYRDVSW